MKINIYLIVTYLTTLQFRIMQDSRGMVIISTRAMNYREICKISLRFVRHLKYVKMFNNSRVSSQKSTKHFMRHEFQINMPNRCLASALTDKFPIEINDNFAIHVYIF